MFITPLARERLLGPDAKAAIPQLEKLLEESRKEEKKAEANYKIIYETNDQIAGQREAYKVALRMLGKPAPAEAKWREQEREKDDKAVERLALEHLGRARVFRGNVESALKAIDDHR